LHPPLEDSLSFCHRYGFSLPVFQGVSPLLGAASSFVTRSFSLPPGVGLLCRRSILFPFVVSTLFRHGSSFPLFVAQGPFYYFLRADSFFVSSPPHARLLGQERLPPVSSCRFRSSHRLFLFALGPPRFLRLHLLLSALALPFFPLVLWFRHFSPRTRKEPFSSRLATMFLCSPPVGFTGVMVSTLFSRSRLSTTAQARIIACRSLGPFPFPSKVPHSFS